MFSLKPPPLEEMSLGLIATEEQGVGHMAKEAPSNRRLDHFIFQTIILYYTTIKMNI